MQLLRVFEAAETGNDENLSEDEAIEKYGQRKFMRWVLITGCISLLCGLWIVTGTLVLSSSGPGAVLSVLNLLTLIIAGCSQFFLFFYASKLLHFFRQKINMSYELAIVLSIYLLSAAAYHVPAILRVKDSDKEDIIHWMMLLAIAPLLRNLAAFFVSAVHPLLQSNDYSLVTYSSTRECAKSLEMTLSSEITYQHFASFLETKHGRGGAAILDLFNRLELYTHKLNKERPVEELEREIVTSCFSDENVKNEIKSLTELSRESLEKEKQFGTVLNMVLERLKECFEEFRRTREFEGLVDVLRFQENISERLQQANLI